MRTAFSPNIKERADCSTAIFDRAGPGHRAGAARADSPGLDGRRGRRDSEAFSAEPRSSRATSSSPTIRTTAAARICPISTSSRRCSSASSIVAFVANIAHHADVGGMVPGLRSGGLQEHLSGRHPDSAGAHHACRHAQPRRDRHHPAQFAHARRAHRRSASAVRCEQCRHEERAAVVRALWRERHRSDHRRVSRFHGKALSRGDQPAARGPL